MIYSKIRKFRRNAKAISPIIATLLLIAIAVVAALVTYAWVMGYVSFQTGNAGNSIQIQNIAYTNSSATPLVQTLTIYVQNTGQGSIKLGSDSLYVNGALLSQSSSSPSPAAVTPGSTSTITTTLPSSLVITSGVQITVKVTTLSGTYNQVAWTFQ